MNTRSLNTLPFNCCNFFLFTFLFFVSIIIGTISHEFGHIIVAEILGYNTTLHFGSMNYIHPNYPNHIDNNFHNIWITLGGMLTTMITGTIGYYFYKNQNKFNFQKIILMFIALFWMRQIINQLFGIFKGLQTGKYFYGDEYFLSKLLNLPSGVFSIATSLIALGVFLKICYDLFKHNLLVEFLSAGLIGGVLGYYMWFEKLGPNILP